MWIMLVTGILYGEPYSYREVYRYQHECQKALVLFRQSTYVLVTSGTCTYRIEDHRE